MSQSQVVLRALCWAVTGVCFLAATPAQADITITGNAGEVSPANPVTWNSTITGNIGINSGNWGAVTVTATGNHTLTSNQGFIGVNAGSTGNVTITGNGSLWTSNYLYVGRYGTGNLTISSSGQVSSPYGYLGYYGGSVGTATVTGNGSVWTTSIALNVGVSGTGNLTISSGGRVNSKDTNINHSSMITVTGTGSTLANTADLMLGTSSGSMGNLTLSAGGQASNATGYLGYVLGSTGNVNVTGSGSAWTNSSELLVGRSGTGNLVISAGGQVSNTVGYLGYNSGSTGLVTVTGNGSTWTSSGDLIVGRDGTGILAIGAGGQVANAFGYLGYNSGSSGNVTVAGNGSLWTNNSTLYVGYSGSGNVAINTGGQVRSTYGYVGIFTGSQGQVTVADAGSAWVLSSGLFLGGDQYAPGGTGILTISNGGQVTSVTESQLGGGTGSTGSLTVTGAGSTWTNNSSLQVGYIGQGNLTVANGGQVSNTYALLGNYVGSTGSATVTGTGSTWTNSGNLTLGLYGTGSLVVSNGGQVSNAYGYVGYNAASMGNVTVSGTGTTWTNNNLYVGYSGMGTLTVSAGGQVSNNAGYLGNNTTSTGTVRVTGPGSAWTNSSSLYVGRYGSGNLTISNGGQISNNYGYSAYYAGSTANLTVTGPGSTWTNSGSLYVSNYGTGTLLIANGGQVHNDIGYVCYQNGSAGTAIVTGPGSIWACNNYMYAGVPGYTGVGSLTLADGGIATARALTVSSVSAANLRVWGDAMVIVGNVTTSGNVANSGKINLFADPFLAAGNYTPITEYAGRAITWSGAGTYPTWGGTWDNTAKVFTALPVTPLAAGATDTLTANERVLFSGSGQQVGASFGAGVAGATFSANLATAGEISSLQALLPANESVLSAWDFTTSLSGNTALLTFDIGLGASNLRTWRLSGNWSQYATPDLIYNGNGTAGFTVNGFSGYGVSGALYAWTGNSSAVWGTNGNWQKGATPANDAFSDMARFDQVSYANQPTVSAALSVGGLVLTGNSANVTINVTGGPLTVGDRGISLAANKTLTFTGNQDITLQAAISGAGGLAINTTGGTTVLTGNNTYTGETKVLAGTLRQGAAGGIPAGTALTANGTVNLNNFDTTIGSLAGTGLVPMGSANLTIGSNNLSTSFSGSISGNGSLTKIGTGTLILSGNNTYSGSTNLNAGAIRAFNNNNLGTTAGALNFDGGTLMWGATFNLSSSRAITLNAGGGTLNTNGYSTTISQNITGTGGLTKSGTGTLTLTGLNTYSGGTYLNGHWLYVVADYNLGDTNGGLTFDGGVLTPGGSFNVLSANRTVTLNAGGGTIYTSGPGATFAIAQAITGVGGLTKDGAGTLILGGANTYAGATNISGGTLQLAANAVIPDTSVVTLENLPEQIFDLNNFSDTIAGLSGGGNLGGNVTLGSGTLNVNQSGNTTFAGGISGTGNLTKSGIGTLILSGASTYSGNTNLSGGVIQAGASDCLGSGRLNFTGGTLQWGIPFDLAASRLITLNSGGGTLDTNGYDTAIAGVISGSGGLTKVGNGTLILTGNNTYSGGTILNAGTLLVRSDSNLGNAAGGLTFNGSTLRWGSSFNLSGNRAIVLNSEGGTLDTDGITTTISQVISGSGGLTKAGAGSLILTGNSTYSGPTNITGGTLDIRNVLTSGGAVTLSSLAQLNAGASIPRPILGAANTSVINVTASGIALGDATSYTGFSNAGSLLVGSNTVTLNSKRFAQLGILTTLAGGTINAPNGIVLDVGSNLVGYGTINGKVAAGFGSVIEATGNLTLGDLAQRDGFYSDGTLLTANYTVTIKDSNFIVLGSYTRVGSATAQGTLTANATTPGFLLEQGKNMVGRGFINGDYKNHGDVIGDGLVMSQRLIFNAPFVVSGKGYFENYAAYSFHPGDSPNDSTVKNGLYFGPLDIELGGTTPGSGVDSHSRVKDLGLTMLTTDATLRILVSTLHTDYLPTIGDTYQIMTWVDGFVDADSGLPTVWSHVSIDPWFTSHGINFNLIYNNTSGAGSLTLQAVPEPGSLALLAFGTLLILKRRRIRPISQPA